MPILGSLESRRGCVLPPFTSSGGLIRWRDVFDTAHTYGLTCNISGPTFAGASTTWAERLSIFVPGSGP